MAAHCIAAMRISAMRNGPVAYGVRGGRAFVSIDDVSWRRELSTQETPEDALIAREEQEEKEESDEDDEAREARNAVIRAIGREKLRGFLEQIPAPEAVALALDLGLLGYPETPQLEIAETLGVSSQQTVSYMVRRARVRVLYLATRPAVDLSVLARALSPSKLEVVRGVYETASFAEAGRRRWPCPTERVGAQRRTWTRLHATRIKRDFFRALATVEKRPELAEQLGALRHLVEHLGALSRHEGKGTWSRAQTREDAPITPGPADSGILTPSFVRQDLAMRPQYQTSDVKRVALKFSVHERTVMKALAGLPVRGLAGERARLAVAELIATARTEVAA